jgi:hypothetical protein
MEYWTEADQIFLFHYSNTPVLHYSECPLVKASTDIAKKISVTTCLTLLTEYRQLFLCRCFPVANFIFTCQFELKAVGQCLPAGFDDVF